MKKTIFIAIAIALITVLLPFLIICNTSGFYKHKQESEDAEGVSDSAVIKVYIKDEDKVEEMNINDYLVGVVAAEIPASFNDEAIKAQAVAARSYLISHINSYKTAGVPENHKGADTCTDHTHCQAWMSEEARRAAWNKDEADANWEKIKDAVLDTSGEVMMYDGSVINAVFHSTSSGKTENAVDVWGSDVPYLKSVESGGDAQSPKFESEVDISVDEYKNIVLTELGADGIDWSKGLFGDIVRSEAGGIITMTVGGVQIKGTKFRTMFGIRSTNAEIAEKDGRVYMSVRGYGHGVGMSQYGANYLAGEGKDYKEILKNYYTGVEVKEISG